MAIVLIGDDESEPEIIGDCINRSFPQVHVCKSIYVAAELIEAHHAELAIFFLSNIETAEKKLQLLYSLCRPMADRELKLLILCKGSESTIAAQLCRENIFDDFLIAQPLQDATQLHWVIERLSNRGSGDSVSQLKTIQTLEKELDALKQTFLGVNTLPASVRSRIDSIQMSLDELIDDNTSGERNNLSLERLLQQFQDTKEQNLAPALAAISNEIGSFTKHLAAQCEQHFSVIDRSINANKQSLKPDSATKLLVVDDNEGFRHIIHDVLEHEGYSVIAISNAQKAISLILRERPALVLVDYDMPGINGLEMIREVSQLLPSDQLPPFVMVTGYSLKNIVEESAHLGVVDFIVKPIRRNTIIEKVKKHVLPQGGNQ